MVEIKEPMKITIEVIDHHEQRYPTVGDWVLNTDKQEFLIYVSNLGNWRMNFLIAFHEMVEAALCMDRGITVEDVDKFDQEFERNRDVDNLSEPGDAPDAPYYKEHFFATSLERLLAAELDVDWVEYENEINKLD